MKNSQGGGPGDEKVDGPVDRGAVTGHVDRATLRRILAKFELLTQEAGPQWSPVALARLAGFDIAVGRDDGSERTTSDCLIYLWHSDARERGMRVYAALARGLLLREGAPHSDHDVWQLATALAIPAAERSAHVDRLVATRPHVPESVIRTIVDEAG